MRTVDAACLAQVYGGALPAELQKLLAQQGKGATRSLADLRTTTEEVDHLAAAGRYGRGALGKLCDEYFPGSRQDLLENPTDEQRFMIGKCKGINFGF